MRPVLAVGLDQVAAVGDVLDAAGVQRQAALERGAAGAGHGASAPGRRAVDGERAATAHDAGRLRVRGRCESRVADEAAVGHFQQTAEGLGAGVGERAAAGQQARARRAGQAAAERVGAAAEVQRGAVGQGEGSAAAAACRELQAAGVQVHVARGGILEADGKVGRARAALGIDAGVDERGSRPAQVLCDGVVEGVLVEPGAVVVQRGGAAGADAAGVGRRVGPGGGAVEVDDAAVGDVLDAWCRRSRWPGR